MFPQIYAKRGQIYIITQNMQQTAKTANCAVIYGLVCLISLTSTCCVCHSAERKSLQCLYFWVCMTTLLLKWSNAANFIRVERKGGSRRWEERLICICIWSGKCKWTKWSDRREMCIPLQLFADREKSYWTGPFTFPQNASLSDI